MLILGALRLRGWNCGVGINIGGTACGNCPGGSEVSGIPIGGGIPTAANWAMLARARWFMGRPAVGIGIGMKLAWIGVIKLPGIGPINGGLKPCWIAVGRLGENIAV